MSGAQPPQGLIFGVQFTFSLLFFFKVCSFFFLRKTLVQFQVMWVQTEVKGSLAGLLQEPLWVLGGVLAEATVGLENRRISQDRSAWEAPT